MSTKGTYRTYRISFLSTSYFATKITFRAAHPPSITHPYFQIMHPYSAISGTCVEIIFLHLTLNALWYDTKGCLV